METENDDFQGLYLLFPFQGLFIKQINTTSLRQMQKSRKYYSTYK